MAINAPYTTTDKVAMLFRKGGVDFDDTTSIPSKTQVSYFIDLVSAHINAALEEAGYVVPLQNLEGETWPTHQTMYLEMLCILGVSAYITSRGFKAPTDFTNRVGASDISFKINYDADIMILKNSLPFRALYRTGTQAERRLTEPKSISNVVISGTNDNGASYEALIKISERTRLIQSLLGDYANKTGETDYSSFTNDVVIYL